MLWVRNYILRGNLLSVHDQVAKQISKLTQFGGLGWGVRPLAQKSHLNHVAQLVELTKIHSKCNYAE